VAVKRIAPPDAGLRTLLAVAVTTTLVGIALSAAREQEIGALVTLLGLLSMIYGLHRFGRSGPDAPVELPRE
jgi:hypothetical protein